MNYLPILGHCFVSTFIWWFMRMLLRPKHIYGYDPKTFKRYDEVAKREAFYTVFLYWGILMAGGFVK